MIEPSYSGHFFNDVEVPRNRYIRWRASYGEHGVVGFVGERGGRERERERDSERARERRERDTRLRALRATRPHTLGHVGGCDQEQGEIEHLPLKAGEVAQMSN